MHVLVTGGSGFLGAWLVKRLAAAGHGIRIFDASSDRSLVSDIAGPSVAEDIDWRCGGINGPGLPIVSDIEEDDLRNILVGLPHTGIRDGVRRTIEYYRQRMHN
jgi:nucleoside-diphosphate-sugar epimerase